MKSISFSSGRKNLQHFVFASKCRFNVFLNQKTKAACISAFKEVSKSHSIEIEEMNFGENHTHLLLNIPSTLSNSQVAQFFKGVSARRIFQNIPNLRKRYPRGSFWSGWYYYGSVGPQTDEVVRRYIQGQQEHHKITDQRQLTLSSFFN